MTGPGETVVLVDAQNVMRSRWPNLPEDRFVAAVRTWAGREGVRAVLVFDGRAPAVPGGEHLDAVGSGARSADDVIAEEAERLAAAGVRVHLVTSDRELRGRAAPFAERITGGGAFAGTLEAL
ncbi:MAG TPA: hypothetical protein VD704_10575 [Gaiellaceae bacterium]|nr:hypothetical protein [Gaiellaceae bacterium]